MHSLPIERKCDINVRTLVQVSTNRFFFCYLLPRLGRGWGAWAGMMLCRIQKTATEISEQIKGEDIYKYFGDNHMVQQKLVIQCDSYKEIQLFQENEGFF